MVVRISRGRFDAASSASIAQLLTESQERLIPAIRRLPGLVSYHAAIDEAAGAIVNVSVWDRLEHAQAMGTLTEMSELRIEFEAQGVAFEQIVNFEAVWSI